MLNFPPAIIRWLDLLRTTTLRRGILFFHSKTIDGEDCYCALGFLCLANQEPPMVNDAGNWPYAQSILDDDLMNRVVAEWDGNTFHTNASFADWLETFLAPHFPVRTSEPT